MSLDQTLFERLTECGLRVEEIVLIPKNIGNEFVGGRVVCLTIERPCPCNHCVGKDHAVFFVTAARVPEWIRKLLQDSTAERIKEA
jgi:hypothetical protein